MVVSRPASKKAQQQNTSPQSCSKLSASSNRNSNNFDNQATELSMTTTENIASSNITKIIDERDDENNSNSILTSSQATSGAVSIASMTAICDNDSSCDLPATTSSQHLCSTHKTTQVDVDQHCDNESTVGSSCSSKSSSNEIEESCLLGIDCNEKTTVGLVLKVLADTAIRLDGDG